MPSICVFLSAAIPKDPRFATATKALGKAFADLEIRLIYGGAKVGLMGILADAALAAGGEVVGVMAKTLKGEITHLGLTELHTVTTMGARKAMMAELADGFIALPGGLGTLEEVFQVWNNRKIGASDKPLGLLNVANYYDHTLEQLKQGVAMGFVKPEHLKLVTCHDNPAALLGYILENMPEKPEMRMGMGMFK